MSDKERKEKALRDYLKKSHNRILRQYNMRHSDIKKLLKSVDFSKLDIKGLKPDEVIKLVEHKILNNQLEEIRKSFQSRMTNLVTMSMYQEWNKAHDQIDSLITKAYNLNKKDYSFLYTRNVAEWRKLSNRHIGDGRTLSGRIWKLSNQYKRDILDTLQIGIANGDSARELAIRLERYTVDANAKFQDIEKLTNKEIHSEMIKRVNRNKKKGSLGSTFKDAKRLSGNETNHSYREAEQERWRSMFIVLGYEIHLSNAHPKYDICDDLAGVYPKTFKWNGWHPSCLCYAIPILMDKKDLIENSARRLRGEEPILKGEVKDVPEGFKTYMREHYERMSKWKSKPYFMQDNGIEEIIREKDI